MKIIAFYLPQFHRTPENDEWWGEGFTEWENMKSAKPLFEGHYQPRVPLGNKYYNLLDVKNIEWQTQIAKEYGIYGFCCYHYWFGGKMLLEKPMELYLQNRRCDLPFCFSWANETWTNAWATENESNRKILIKQEYGDKDEWEEHFQYLLPFFKDERYIKEGNKPLFVIYRPQYIPKLNERLSYYNKRAVEEGFDGLVFASQHVSFLAEKDADRSMFKYQIEYQPGFAFYDMDSWMQKRMSIWKQNAQIWARDHLKYFSSIKRAKLQIISYDDVWRTILKRKAKPNHIPGAFVNWDNTPRYKEKGKVLVGSTPEKFQGYMERQLRRAIDEYKSEYLFIFAWNEWSEGGYLEPDEKYKYEYLEAIKGCIDALSTKGEQNESASN
ncbi:MAG: glycoside hydrolase family 99-like domain-containing protein [Lachnospiraceae bacterium]|nr:glycoside hydrolase family 99-like domain-containing protein [Lachnospiraceae bacterium]